MEAGRSFVESYGSGRERARGVGHPIEGGPRPGSLLGRPDADGFQGRMCSLGFNGRSPGWRPNRARVSTRRRRSGRAAGSVCSRCCLDVRSQHGERAVVSSTVVTFTVDGAASLGGRGFARKEADLPSSIETTGLGNRTAGIPGSAVSRCGWGPVRDVGLRPETRGSTSRFLAETYGSPPFPTEMISALEAGTQLGSNARFQQPSAISAIPRPRRTCSRMPSSLPSHLARER